MRIHDDMFANFITRCTNDDSAGVFQTTDLQEFVALLCNHIIIPFVCSHDIEQMYREDGEGITNSWRLDWLVRDSSGEAVWRVMNLSDIISLEGLKSIQTKFLNKNPIELNTMSLHQTYKLCDELSRSLVDLIINGARVDPVKGLDRCLQIALTVKVNGVSRVYLSM